MCSNAKSGFVGSAKYARHSGYGKGATEGNGYAIRIDG